MRRENEESGYVFFMVFLVVVPVFAFPLLLLMTIQLRFLPYQSEALTAVHQACVVIDLVIQFVFAVRLDPVRRFMALVLKGEWLERVGSVTWGLYALLFLVLSPSFFLFVAVVPGSWLERHRPLPDAMNEALAVAFGDWWEDDGCAVARYGEPPFFKRYVRVEGMTVMAGRRDGAIVAAFLAKGEDPELAWQFVEELDLGGRSFRYAWFDGSSFPRATFGGSDLRCAQFNGARLRGANLEGANAQGADFRAADLTGARLEDGTFGDASFRWARLDGANVAGATFAGASFRQAGLHGTDLSGARLRETDLRDAELYGTDLTNAEILGANADGAGLHGVRLDGANLEGTTFRGAGFYGTDMQGVRMDLFDFRGARWERPAGWMRIRQAIEDGTGKRTGEPQGTRGESPGAFVAE